MQERLLARGAFYAYHIDTMPWFHWFFCAFMMVLAGLLLISQARRAQPGNRRQKGDVCSLCGEESPPDQLIERTFISGYRRKFCGKCASELYQEANQQGLINHEHLDTRPIGPSEP